MDSEPCPIRILLVDDHALFLAGVRSLIEDDGGLTIVGEATNRTKASCWAEQRPDLILLYLDLGGEFGLDFLPELLQISEKSRILVMTGLPDPELDLRAVRLGASGVVSKTVKADCFLKAIRKVHAGEAWLKGTLVAAVVTDFAQRRRPVIRQYSPAAKAKQNTIAKRYRSGSACPLVLIIGLCGFRFQLGNLQAHVRNIPLQSFLRHKERTEQVPTQIEKSPQSIGVEAQLCGPAFVAMMQSADLTDFNDPASL
jgi:DNA-binding NarL/FixJ family response regulator